MDGLPFHHFATVVPAADRKNLSGLSGSEIRSWTVTKAEEYRNIALGLLAIHNFTVPFHRLPNELLSLIFVKAWHDRNSFRLAHVCRQWRQVLLSTPEFWVEAVSAYFCVLRDPPAYLAAILERSQPLPIQPAFSRLTEALSQTLDSELWRMTALHVHAETTDEIICLHDMLRQGMPVLKELIVEYQPEECGCRCDCDDCRACERACEYEDIQLDLEPLTANAIPRLQDVDVPAFWFPKVAAPSLRLVRVHREFSGFYDHENPRTNILDLLNALAGCPELVRLELSRVLPHEDDIRRLSSRAGHMVALPALQRFHIEGLPSEIVALMPRFILPPTACVRIHDCTSSSGMWDLWKYLKATMLFSGVDRADFTMSRWTNKSVLDCYAGGQERLQITSSLATTIPDIADAFRAHASVTQLTWTSEMDYLHEHHTGLRLLLPALPHLKSLTILSSGPAGVVALSALKPSDDITAEDVVCPRLEQLTLVLCWSQIIYESQCPLPRGTADMQEKEAVARFSDRCADLQSVLSARASRLGTRLTYLQYHECYSGPVEGSESSRRIFKLDETTPYWSIVEPAIRAVRDLVDGPFNFAGCNPTETDFY
ncbi:hypothetical protein K466DRAFT_406814 [Polyporus arcularius HHB13444]|uniref:F-box domain-containing protein n=1 Tax=Polyporus arcularius HHB13444 TaxID=1314778 RepID=A0A5C3NTZ0_9APHY|nr:hypothetical protein K466DRAFT_406814 [Polyporus arcularius HHB13444]